MAGLLATTGGGEARERRERERDRDVAIKPPAQSYDRAYDRGPLTLVVSVRKQRLRIYDAEGEIASTRVSTGMPGFDTPTGVFSVLEKKERHYSNIYAGAPMPFMQRLTWSGIALHSGVVPGYRASHGCIRMPHSFARSLFGLTRAGVRVVIAQDETQPVRFSHPKLFKPLPDRIAPQVASAPDTRVAANDAGGTGAESMSEFSSMLGVTPALAAAAADMRADAERPQTRADAERRVAERIADADSKQQAAQSTRVAALETAKASVRAADELAVRLATAKRAVEPERRVVRTAEGNLVAAQRAFEAFLSAPVNLASTAAEDRESDLENAILDASIALAEARAKIEGGALEFAALEAEAAAADRARAVAVVAVRAAETNLKSTTLQLAEAANDAKRRNRPVAVLVSLRSGRVYVRQGVEPIVEAPITMSEPARKIGTYVLTAVRYDPNNPDAFEWRLVTAQPPSFVDRDERRKRKSTSPELLPAQGAAGAVLGATLDSLTLPPDVLATIAERARPGAALIISDRELSASENGPNTEFVLLTR